MTKNVLLVGDDISVKSGIATQLRLIGKALQGDGWFVSNFGYNGRWGYDGEQKFAENVDGMRVARFGAMHYGGGGFTNEQVAWLQEEKFGAVVCMLPGYDAGNLQFVKFLKMVLGQHQVCPPMVLYFVWDAGVIALDRASASYMVHPEILDEFDRVVPATLDASVVFGAEKECKCPTGIVPHAVDEMFWRVPTKAERSLAREKLFGAEEDQEVLLWSGRPLSRKNLGLALEAASILEEDRGVKFLLHTNPDDPAGGDVQNLVSVLGPKGLTWIQDQSLSDEAFRDLFWASDAFLNTSTMEGFGVPMVQALCTGLRCFATPTNGAAEISEAMGSRVRDFLLFEDGWPGMYVTDKWSIRFGVQYIGRAQQIVAKIPHAKEWNTGSIERSASASAIFGRARFYEQWRSILSEVVA